MTDTRPLVLLDCEHGAAGYRAGCRCGTCKQGNTQRGKLYRDTGTSAGTAQRGRRGRPNRRDAAPDRGWMEHAPCRGADQDLFYSTRDEDSSPEVYREARRICAPCPYRAKCLEYAIETRETHGLWGGLSPKQRRVEIARRRTADASATRKANNAADRAARIAAAGITP